MTIKTLAESAESAEIFKEYPEWVNEVKSQRAQKVLRNSLDYLFGLFYLICYFVQIFIDKGGHYA